MNQTEPKLRQVVDSSSGLGGRPRGLLPSLGGLLALALAARVLASLLLLPRILPILIGLLQCGQLWVVVIGSWFVSFYSHLFQQQILLVLFVSLGIA